MGEEQNVAWDCNPDMVFVDESYDLDLNYEDDTGYWQVLALDRFGDRNVNSKF